MRLLNTILKWILKSIENKKKKAEKDFENKPNLIIMKETQFRQLNLNDCKKIELVLSPFKIVKDEKNYPYYQHMNSTMNFDKYSVHNYYIKNKGKRDIINLNIISNFKKNIFIYEKNMTCESLILLYVNNMVNYDICYENIIEAGEVVNLKIYFPPKAEKLFKVNNSSALLSIVFEDDHYNRWEQLFWPESQTKLIEPRKISYEYFYELKSPRKMIEFCWKKLN